MARLAGVVAVLVATAACAKPQLAPQAARVSASPGPVSAILGTPGATASLPPTMEQLMRPYTLAGMRERQFKAGKLESRAEVLKTDVFTRFAITYRSDGLLIHGTLQIPREGKSPFPVIMMNHGFFSRAEYHSGDGTDRAAEYLNRHGYLTLSSDYRSWGESDVGPSLYYSGLVIDVVNLMMTVDSIPEADPARMGIWGHSMGGGVTMKVLTLNTPVKAAVLYSTVSADDSDLLQRWGLGCIGDIKAGENQLDCNSSDVVPLDLSPDLIRAYYESSLDPLALESTSPIDHLDWVTVPIQIHYGMEDGKDMVGTPPEWSLKLFGALDAAGKAVEIYKYEDAAHSFVGDSWITLMERTSHFFDEYVKFAAP
ncbi:MAG TPA: alpha/beta hydrolase [Anaerolineales bacterium]